MSVYTRIVAAAFDDVDFESGFNGAKLDGGHTLVWCSDHPRSHPPKSEEDLRDFVREYETIDSHPNEENIGGSVSTPEDHPGADSSTFPDNAEFDSEKLPTVAVENGRIFWERF